MDNQVRENSTEYGNKKEASHLPKDTSTNWNTKKRPLQFAINQNDESARSRQDRHGHELVNIYCSQFS